MIEAAIAIFPSWLTGPRLMWGAGAVTVVVMILWGVRTVVAEHSMGSRGGFVARTRQVRILDVVLWVACVIAGITGVLAIAVTIMPMFQ